MAWSQAARDAALEARRAHMKGKGGGWLAAYNRGEGTKSALKEEFARKAAQLRAKPLGRRKVAALKRMAKAKRR